MNTYTFDIVFAEDDIMRHSIVAASRCSAEMIASEEYPDAIDMIFIDVE